MVEKIRVLVRLFQFNPRRFVVKDPAKIAVWRVLASKNPWSKGYGIRIDRFRES